MAFRPIDVPATQPTTPIAQSIDSTTQPPASGGFRPIDVSGVKPPAAKPTDQSLSSTTPPVITQHPQAFSDILKNLSGKVGNIIQDRSEKAGQIADNTDISGKVSLNPFVSQNKNSMLSGAIQETGNAIGAGGDIVGAVAAPVVKPLLNADVSIAKGAYNLFAPGWLKSIVSKGADVAKAEIVPKLQAMGVNTASDWADFSQKHPVAAGDIGGAINIASVFPAVKGAEVAGTAVKEGAVAVGEGMAKSAAEKAVAKTPKGIIDKLMATPEEDLPKLSSDQRAQYFNQKKANLETSQKAIEETSAKQKADITSATERNKASASIDLKNKSASLQKEAESLAVKSDSSAKATTLDLRPKAKALLGKQSKMFQTIFEKEFTPEIKATEVAQPELEAYIKGQYGAIPGKSEQIISDLGLKAGDKTSKSTLGDIYSKIREIKGGMSSASKTGTKVFTEADKKADDLVNVLNGFMKSKGVDLSESNKFWSEWAPVRNKIVTQIKPFSKVDFDTDTFVNTLKRAASGTNKDSKSFVDVLEKQLGEPFSAEQKSILAKLDANKRAQVANEIEQNLSAEFQDTEAAKATENIDKSVKSSKSNIDSAKEALSNKKFSVNEKAAQINKRKSIIKKALIGVGIAGASAVGAGEGAKLIHSVIP